MKTLTKIEIAMITLALAGFLCSQARAEEFFIASTTCTQAVEQYERLEEKRRTAPEAVLLTEATDSAYLVALQACGLEDKFVN